MSQSGRESKPIFLDYHSTTPVDPRVADVMRHFMLEEFGNASSSQHLFGERALSAVTAARKHLLELIHASSAKVVFTSGATEAINIVFRSLADKHSTGEKLRMALMRVEHSAVLECVKHFEKSGAFLPTYLQVDNKGRLDLHSLEQALKDGLDLVCVMAANNEIGNVYPLKEIGALCATFDVPFFCDASQALGKIPLDFDEFNITYMIASAHKMYGPKGIGALICKRSFLPKPSSYGGEQEYGVRPGTLNVPAIAAFGEAAKLRMQEMLEDEKQILGLRNTFAKLLAKEFPTIIFNGDPINKLAGNLHFSLPNISSDVLVARTHNKLALSTGAACYSGVEQPSHVLLSLGLDRNLVDGALRIGLGKFTSAEEIERAVSILSEEVSAIQNLLGPGNVISNIAS